MREKAELLEELRERIGEDGVERARKDWHARRRPRPCGLTIHTSVGCAFGCVYCYIYDMGFPRGVKEYSLSPQELLYAVLSNPYFVPGSYGTLIAVGSVTEPFSPNVKAKSIQYIKALASLGNPVQVSTKALLLEEDVRELSSVGLIDVLISVTTLRMCKALEPGAPHAIDRMKSAKLLASYGLHPTLFLRPILPGITDREAHEILKLAVAEGFDSVVLGTLRVTENILAKLNRANVVIPPERLPKLRGRAQLPIKASDLKRRISRIAEGLGLRVLPASCSSNIVAHGQACAMCKMGPCGDVDKMPKVYEDDVAEFLEQRGIRAEVVVNENNVIVKTPNGRLPDDVKYVVQTVCRREIVVMK